MSLKAICQIILYFESFKNIDLGQQGVYMLKARIKSQDQYAPPHRNFETTLELKSRKKNKIKQEADLIDNQYKTKAFTIKYNDEEIDLEEVVVFRLQLETMPHLSTNNIYLYLDLYYSVDYIFGFDSQKDKALEYEKVDSLKLKLNGVERGMCSYATASFSDSFKSTVKFYAMSIMVDIKFRTWKLLKKEKTHKQKERESICSVKEYFQYFLNHTKLGESGFYRKYIKSLIELSQQAKKNLLKYLGQTGEYVYKLPKYCLANKETSFQLVEVQPKQYMQYINVYKIQNYSPKMFQDEIQQIATDNHMFFQSLLKRLEQNELNKVLLKMKYDEFCKERFGEFIFQSQVAQDDLSGEKCSIKQKISLAKKIRNKRHYFQNLEAYQVEEDEKALSQHPILFHEITQMNKFKQKDYQIKNQLFVLSHGFQGTSEDMTAIKNNFKLYFPKASFLLSRSNEGLTNGDIGKMGQRLAEQVLEFINDQNIRQGLIIHYIGHSLGGVILRASLKHLDQYKNNFGTFMTLSSPHLSYLNGTKTSIETGLWLIKKWKKIQAIDQMTMSDHKNLQETFLFKLSKEGSLKNFNRVVLLSSPEDSYVPWHSARIHRSSNWSGQSIALQNLMTNNILCGDKIHKIHRIDVNFHISERNIDSVIGRAAHIKFLGDETVLRMLLSCISQLFQ